MLTYQIDGRNLRALRELRGYSLSEIAARVGVSVPHLSRVERGERDMAAGTAAKIAEVLGIPVGTILNLRREETVA